MVEGDVQTDCASKEGVDLALEQVELYYCSIAKSFLEFKKKYNNNTN